MTTAPATRRTAPVDVWWTPWPGTGPGTNLLAPIQGRHIIELGCGNGDNAAALASAGAHVVAVDKSATAIRHARARWHHQPRLRFVHDDAATYLAAPSGRDAEIVCSIFGALTFMPADELLPRIAARLSPPGLLVTSHREPAERRALPGYTYTRDAWAAALRRHGFRVARTTTVVPPPNSGTSGCLITVAAPSRLPTSREAM